MRGHDPWWVNKGTVCVCVCMDGKGWGSPCVQLAGWQVRVWKAGVTRTCRGGNWSTYSEDTHTHKHFLQTRGEKIDCCLQGHVREQESQQTHNSVPSSARWEVPNTWHAATKEGGRESKTSQSARIWKDSAQTGQQHGAPRGARPECVNMPRPSAKIDANTKHWEPGACVTRCSVNKPVVMHLNASAERDYLPFHFPVLKKDRKWNLLNLSACVRQVLHPQGTMSNYFCILHREKNCTMRKP